MFEIKAIDTDALAEYQDEWKGIRFLQEHGIGLDNKNSR